MGSRLAWSGELCGAARRAACAYLLFF